MLINCAAYQHGQKIADIQLAEIGRYKTQADGFVWVALKDPETAELEALQHEFGLHKLAVEDAQHGHQRPKMDEYGAALFVVLQLIDQKGHELVTGEVAIFVGPNYLVTVRRDSEHGFADVRARSEQEPALLKHGPAYVLYALMDAVVDRYFPVLDDLTEEIDEICEPI